MTHGTSIAQTPKGHGLCKHPVCLYDTSGWCDRDEHGSCSGELRGARGWSWWCACPCHPEPVVKNPKHQPAVDMWREKRAALLAAQEAGDERG